MGKTRRGQLGQRKLLIAVGGGIAVILIAVLLLNGYGSSGPAAGSPSGSNIPHFALPKTCTNTCYKANDGVCDEGRPSSKGSSVVDTSKVNPLLCDLGTDCNDCGPWKGTRPPKWDAHEGPIAWLRSQNVHAQARMTTTPIPFLMAVSSPEADPNVSAMITNYGAMEGGISRVVHWILSNGGCFSRNGRKRVLDVGAAMGYHSLMAAMYGCYVTAWEPLRTHRAFFEWARHANHLTPLIDIRPTSLGASDHVSPPNTYEAGELEEALAAGPGSQAGQLSGRWEVMGSHSGVGRRGFVRIGVAKDGTYWGLASVDNLNLKENEVRGQVWSPVESLDHWWKRVTADGGGAQAGAAALGRLGRLGGRDKPTDEIALIKMDVEGYEPKVIAGGQELLSNGKVDNILLEYTPGVGERRKDMALQEEFPKMLMDLVTNGGYEMAHLPLFSFAAPWPPKPINGSEPLPPLEQITADELQYDIKALEKKKSLESANCAVDDKLKAFPVWANCNEWTFAAHPKGFRSTFAYNTNIWASRVDAPTRKIMQLAGRASLFTAEQDMKVWTSQSRPGIGMGLVECSSVGAGHKVLHRCDCGKDAAEECTKQEAVVKELLAEGKMPIQ